MNAGAQLNERHKCGCRLVRIDAEDSRNNWGQDMVLCPVCMETFDSVDEAIDGGAYLPDIHIGDHVTDREGTRADGEATMLVVATAVERADEYDVDDGKTVADYNPDYASEVQVFEVTYPQRTDPDVANARRYAFPRGRLRLETPVHDRDDEDGGDADGA